MVRENLVSVIITTRNEGKVIKRLLMSLKRQSHNNLEIILVDNGSTDQTKDISKTFTEKVYNFGPERSAQRNFGAKKGRGNYLFFLDADMKLTKDVVRNCVGSMKKDGGVGAIAIKEEPVARSFWEKVKAFERSFYNLEGDETTDAARFFRKEVFWEVGGYDEKITGPEDWDITDKIKRSGYKIEWVDSIIYHYERIPNPLKLAQKKYYYGLKSHIYLSKHKISPLSAKTVYFLRPIFYKNFKKVLAHPILVMAMFIMLTLEIIGGGLGYLVGKVKYA